MKDLIKAREEIDLIDTEIIRLFEKRMDIVKDVAIYKIANKLPVLDSSRENAMLEKKKTGNFKFISFLIGGVIVLILALFLSILFGKAHVDIPTIFDAIFNYNPKRQKHPVWTRNTTS